MNIPEGKMKRAGIGGMGGGGDERPSAKLDNNTNLLDFSLWIAVRLSTIITEERLGYIGAPRHYEPQHSSQNQKDIAHRISPLKTCREVNASPDMNITSISEHGTRMQGG